MSRTRKSLETVTITLYLALLVTFGAPKKPPPRTVNVLVLPATARPTILLMYKRARR
ncbi:MAG TPA: hypothetical protein VND89_08735 [Acidimicrobiales bacterium]|nr:hypothetical protein [Acidimicrobiales bacterium]